MVVAIACDVCGLGVGSMGRDPLNNDSKRCNRRLELKVLLGGIRCLVRTFFPPLYGDSI